MPEPSALRTVLSDYPHTLPLKRGEVTAQLDHLREQSDSLQKILKEVE